MMSLYFNGCSNTWGGELKDLDDRYSKIVCDHYGIEDYNHGECGRSNDRITCSTIKQIVKNPKIDWVIIQYTIPSRYRWFDDRGREHHWTPTDRNKKNYNSFARNQWYKYVYNRHIGIENMWKNIFLFDNYCKSIGQKYIALIADLWSDDLDIDAHWKKTPCPIRMHRDIIKDESLLLEHKHPSSEGHKKIAEFIIEHVDSH